MARQDVEANCPVDYFNLGGWQGEALIRPAQGEIVVELMVADWENWENESA
ncbi:MAG: hypothetical protein J5I90_10625 [Caldilineales bacterium]|nr:hypothetical protein [Caldilineales bacterium]